MLRSRAADARPGAWPSPGARPRGWELLDDPRADPAAVRAELGDIVRLNRLFGGTRAVLEALEPFFREAVRGASGVVSWTLLDVGTGAGDIPQVVARAARRYGIAITPIGVEVIPTAARLAREAGLLAVLADGDALPFAPKSVDVVVASQVLHHLSRVRAVRWLGAFDRLARRVVVVADLRRSRAAMAGMWLAAAPLGFGATTRRDAVTSLRRGYRRPELDAMLAEAGVAARARYRPWARIVAAWEPKDAFGHRLSVVGERPRTDNR